MFKLLRLIFAICLTISNGLVVADTQIRDSISLEFAEGLLQGRDFGQATFYSDIVDSFPRLNLPDQFELIGSVDLVTHTRVILHSPLTTQDSRHILADSLNNSHFSIVPKPSDTPNLTGFVWRDNPVLPLGFCHDRLGHVTARFRQSGSSSLVTLDHSLSGPLSSRNCQDYIEQQRKHAENHHARLSSGLRAQLPRLVMPLRTDDGIISILPGASSTGSENSYEATTMLVTSLSTGTIYDYLADQIDDQGWEPISENSPEGKIIGEWSNPTPSDVSVIGTLTVREMGDQKLSIVLRVDRELYIQNSGPLVPRRIQSVGH